MVAAVSARPGGVALLGVLVPGSLVSDRPARRTGAARGAPSQSRDGGAQRGSRTISAAGPDQSGGITA